MTLTKCSFMVVNTRPRSGFAEVKRVHGKKILLAPTLEKVVREMELAVLLASLDINDYEASSLLSLGSPIPWGRTPILMRYYLMYPFGRQLARNELVNQALAPDEFQLLHHHVKTFPLHGTFGTVIDRTSCEISYAL